MKLLRYLDPKGKINFGHQTSETEVERLDGDPYIGLTPTGEAACVQKILAPIEPLAILCIGLNYKRHAVESGLKAPELPILFVKGPIRFSIRGTRLKSPHTSPVTKSTTNASLRL